MALTFGIEEEFVLLDPATLAPVDCGLDAVAELDDQAVGSVVREFLPSQVEFASAPCATADEALAQLGGFRHRLSAWADDVGVVAAGTGTPFRVGGATPSWDGRYAVIAADIGAIADEHHINGLHVHVGIPDRDDRVHASNGLRPWQHVLLALSSNSPYWAGRDTDFASWRAIHSRRWTTYGVTPWFTDAAEYDATFELLSGVGATSDAGAVNWYARLSAKHPTLETRTCDVQLDPASTVALAVVVRALVAAALERSAEPPDGPEAWDAALWHSARWGTAGTLLDPETVRLAPATAVLARLHARVSPYLADRFERVLVDGYLRRVVECGTGAAFQRRAAQQGCPALAGLYRHQLAGGTAATRPRVPARA